MKLIKGTGDAKATRKGASATKATRGMKCPCGGRAFAVGDSGEFKCACGRTLRTSKM